MVRTTKFSILTTKSVTLLVLLFWLYLYWHCLSSSPWTSKYSRETTDIRGYCEQLLQAPFMGAEDPSYQKEKNAILHIFGCTLSILKSKEVLGFASGMSDVLCTHIVICILQCMTWKNCSVIICNIKQTVGKQGHISCHGR